MNAVQGFYMASERAPIGRQRSTKSRRTRVRSSLYEFTPNDAQSMIELRKRLRKMNDTELFRFGKAAEYMCSPQANEGRPARESFVIQLQEARAEWKRRNPELPLRDSI
jgi:hypothetical protein